jgi:hypothetical protein
MTNFTISLNKHNITKAIGESDYRIKRRSDIGHGSIAFSDHNLEQLMSLAKQKYMFYTSESRVALICCIIG